MASNSIWLLAGVRTPFVGIDGPFAQRDSLTLSVPVVQQMAARARGPIDFGVWGAVIPNLAYANLAREVWLEAKLDPYVPARRAHVSGRGSTKRPTNRFCCSRCPDSRVNRDQSAQMRERVARGSPQQ